MSDGEMPEDRCGFVLESEDMPEHAQNAQIGPFPKEVQDYDNGSDDWYAVSEAVCCWREVWARADDSRCIWHAVSEDKLARELVEARANRPERLDGAYVPDVELAGAIDFNECRLWAATLDGTNLGGGSFTSADVRFVQFINTNLNEAQFPNADIRATKFLSTYLHDTQFHRADLTGARFLDADLTFAQFHNTDLLGVQLLDTDLRHTQFLDADLRNSQFRDADFRYAQFFGTDFRNARFPDANLLRAQFIDPDFQGTSFEGAYMNLGVILENDGIYRTTVFGWSDLELNQEWERAAREYRALQQTFREHALPGEVRRYRIREMHMRRKAAFPSSPIQWAKLALARWTTLYAESPYRVTATAVAVIIGCALVYPFVGGVVEPTVSAENSTTHALQRIVSVNLELPEWGTELLVSLYFSVVTFTTLGYGDLRPATAEAQALATFESFVGALLMALLVFVLGRRVTW